MNISQFIRNRSLGTKIIGAFVIIAAMFTVVIVLVVSTNIFDFIDNNRVRRLDEETALLETNLEDEVEELVTRVERIAGNVTFLDALQRRDGEALENFLNSNRTLIGDLADIDVYDARGNRLINISSDDINVNEADETAFALQALLGRDVINLDFIGVDEADDIEAHNTGEEAHLHEGDILAVLEIAVPIFNVDEDIVGVFTVGSILDEDFVDDINLGRQATHLRLVHEGHVVLQSIDSSTETIFDGNEAVDINHSEFLVPIDNGLIQRALEDGTIYAPELYTEGSVSHAVAYVPFSVSGPPSSVWVVEVNFTDITAFIRDAGLNILVALVVGVAIFTLISSLFMRRVLVLPIRRMQELSREIASGRYGYQVAVTSGDELGKLTEDINSLSRDMENTLEEINRRARALEASAEISRDMSKTLDPFGLANSVVRKLYEEFGYYHVHFYEFYADRQVLRVMAGSGRVGLELMEEGHTIAINQGLVGRAAYVRESILIPDVRQEPSWLPNPKLPDTKAEVAVPLISAGKLYGVLDVQSNQYNGLSKEDELQLRIIGDQFALALQVAYTYLETQGRVESEEAINAINAKIQSATTIEEVVRIAAEELGQSLGVPRVNLELGRLN